VEAGQSLDQSILRVSKENIFSDLNNLGVYGVLDAEFNASFGFTQPEVQQLFEQRGLPRHLPTARAWYDGYCFAGATLYNPWSIIGFVGSKTHEPRPYWVNTSDNALIGRLIAASGPGFKHELLALLQPDAVPIRRPLDPAVPLRNLVAALFRLENSRGVDEVRRVVEALIEWLQEPEQAGLRRAFVLWFKRVFMPARVPQAEVPELQDLQEVQTMLAERVVEWTRQ